MSEDSIRQIGQVRNNDKKYEVEYIEPVLYQQVEMNKKKNLSVFASAKKSLDFDSNIKK